jgi:hypothetical protein
MSGASRFSLHKSAKILQQKSKHHKLATEAIPDPEPKLIARNGTESWPYIYTAYDPTPARGDYLKDRGLLKKIPPTDNTQTPYRNQELHGPKQGQPSYHSAISAFRPTHSISGPPIPICYHGTTHLSYNKFSPFNAGIHIFHTRMLCRPRRFHSGMNRSRLIPIIIIAGALLFFWLNYHDNEAYQEYLEYKRTHRIPDVVSDQLVIPPFKDDSVRIYIGVVLPFPQRLKYSIF